jgi:hypothetical protein
VTETATHLTQIRADLMRAVTIDADRARVRRARVRFGGPALAGIVVVTALTVGIWPWGGDRVDPAAAAVLHRAAVTAAAQPALPALIPGRFYHFTDTETGWAVKRRADAMLGTGVSSCLLSCPALPADWGVKAPVIAQTWIAADGRALRTVTLGKATFRDAQVRADYAAGKYGFPVAHPFGATPPDRFPASGTTAWSFGPLSLHRLEHLPADPAKLGPMLSRLASGSSHPTNVEEFTVVGDIMRVSPLRPGVRAAFYTILSRLPGISLVGRVKDPLGRPGIEVAMGDNVLIFDPHTAQLLSDGGGGYSDWSIDRNPPTGF